MRPSLFPLALVALLVLGLLAWLGLRTDALALHPPARAAYAPPPALEPSAPPSFAEEQATALAAQAAQAAPVAPSAPASERTPRRGAAGEGDEAPEDELVRRARLARGPPPVLAGRVVDAGGQPLAGVRVLARALLADSARARVAAGRKAEREDADALGREILRQIAGSGLSEEEQERIRAELVRLGYLDAGTRPRGLGPDEFMLAPALDQPPAWPLDAPAWVELELAPRETSTDAQGRFELAGLQPGALRLALRPPPGSEGLATLEREDVRLAGAGTTELGELVLGGARRVRVRLLGEEGPLAREELLGIDPSERRERRAPVGAERPALLAALAPEEPAHVPASAGLPLGRFDESGALDLWLGPQAWSLVVDAPLRGALRFDGLVPEGLEPLDLELRLPEGVALEAHLAQGAPRRSGPPDPRVLELWPAAFVHEPLFGGLAPLGARTLASSGGSTLTLAHLAAQEPLVARVLAPGEPFLAEDPWSPPVLTRGGSNAPLVLWHQESAALEFVAPAQARWTLLGCAAPLRGAHEGERWRIDGVRPAVRAPRLRLALEGFAERALEVGGLRPGEVREIAAPAPRPLERIELALRAREDGRPLRDAQVLLFAVSGGEAGALLARTSSDGRGLARLDLPAGPLRIALLAPEREPRLLDSPFGADVPLRVELEPGASVRVRALDGDGQPLAALGIVHEILEPRLASTLGPALARELVQTDVEGRVRFAGLGPGKHRFAFARPAELAAQSAWTVIDLGAGATRELVLADDPWGSLSLVLSERRVPLAGARVELAPLDRLARAGPDGPSPTLHASADALGRVAFERVPTGTWRLTVQHTSWLQPAHERLRVRPGRLERALELERARFVGRVLGAEGATVAEARLRLVPERLRGAPSRGESLFEPPLEAPQVRAGPDGSFALEGLEPEAAGWLEVRAREGYGRWWIEAQGGPQALELRLEPWAAVVLASEPGESSSWLWIAPEFGERTLVPLDGEQGLVPVAVPPGRVRVGSATLDGFGRVHSARTWDERTLEPGALATFEPR